MSFICVHMLSFSEHQLGLQHQLQLDYVQLVDTRGQVDLNYLQDSIHTPTCFSAFTSVAL